MELNDYGKAGEEAIHRLLLVYGDWFPDRVPSGDVPSSMYGIERVAALVADVRLFCERWDNDWFQVLESADDLFIEGVDRDDVCHVCGDEATHRIVGCEPTCCDCEHHGDGEGEQYGCEVTA